MVFQVRLLHKIIALIIIAIQLSGCSGNRWVTTYDQTVKIKAESKVFINQKNQNYFELHDAQTLDNQLIGYVLFEEEINSIPRELEYVVVYHDSQITSNDADSLKISIPFESIIKVRVFEYNHKTKSDRTITLVLFTVVPLLIITIALSSIDVSGGMSSN